jgi:uncharacterized short protein YbdD (DUF466 family)
MWGSRYRSARAGLEQMLRVVRRVSWMPDYAAHVEHLARCHPDRTVPSPEEFFQAYVRARYGDGPTRCC